MKLTIKKKTVYTYNNRLRESLGRSSTLFKEDQVRNRMVLCRSPIWSACCSDPCPPLKSYHKDLDVELELVDFKIQQIIDHNARQTPGSAEKMDASEILNTAEAVGIANPICSPSAVHCT